MHLGITDYEGADDRLVVFYTRRANPGRILVRQGTSVPIRETGSAGRHALQDLQANRLLESPCRISRKSLNWMDFGWATLPA